MKRFAILMLLVMFAMAPCMSAEQENIQVNDRDQNVIRSLNQPLLSILRTPFFRKDETDVLFEDFTWTEFPPPGWARYQFGDTQVEWERTTDTFYSAPACAHNFWSSEGRVLDNWLVSPQLTVPSGGALRYYEKGDWVTDYTYHAIFISTGSGDPGIEDYGDFIELYETGAPQTTWTQRHVPLDDYAGQSVFLAFVYQGDFGCTWYIDDVRVFGVYDYGVSMTQVTPDSWAQIGDSIYYTLFVKNEGGITDYYSFSLSNTWGQGIFIDTDNTPVDSPLILDPGEELFVYLKVSVPEGTYPGTVNTDHVEIIGTGVSAELTINTKAIDFIYAENFNSGIPDSWNIVEMGDPTPEDRNWHWYGPGKHVRHLWTQHGEYADNWLITDNISLNYKDQGSIWLKVRELGPDHIASGYYGYHGIWVSDGSPDPVDGGFSQLIECIPFGEWSEHKIDIGHYAGKNIFIAFVYQGIDRDAWVVDDILIYNDGFTDQNLISVSLYVQPFHISQEASPQGSGFYEHGDIVNISVQYVEHYIFSGWIGDHLNILDDPSSLFTTFIMPDHDIEFTAVFEPEFTPECTLEESLNVDYTWTTSTSPPGLGTWFGQSEQVHTGICAAQSGEISHEQSTSVHTTVEGPADLSFFWAVSSEYNKDFLSFFINGALMDRISGIMDWHEKVYQLPQGTFDLTWTYSKNSSGSDGEDCGWLENINLVHFPEEPEFIWAKKAGGNFENNVFDIAVDTSGNTYITGHFRGTAYFGDIQLVSAGIAPSIFIAKLDVYGNFLWAKKAGGPDWDSGLSIFADSDGNIYVTGYFSQTAYFGDTQLVSPGFHSIFIARLDSDGNYLWVTQAGGTGWDDGNAITVDQYGYIYITGQFEGTASFGDIQLVSNSYIDIFVAKLDQNGNFIWAKNAGGTSVDIGTSISLDNSGNIYITGYFWGNAYFDNIYLVSLGEYDVFIAKLDPDANFLWAKRAGGTEMDGAFGIVTDEDGNSYIAGDYQGTAYFGNIPLVSEGGYDIFITRIDTNGNFVWAKRAGGSAHDSCRAMAFGPCGNIFITGDFGAIASFGDFIVSSSGQFDIYIAKINTDGDFLWVKSAGGPLWCHGLGISVGPYGNPHVAGIFEGTAYFDDIQLISGGDRDIFITVLSSDTMDAPDASVVPSDISYYPSNPVPGDIVTISARIRNLGTTNINSGTISFYHSLFPDTDLVLLASQAFGIIEGLSYIDVSIEWDTAGLEERPYIITVCLTDILPMDINPNNNKAFIEVPLPVELAYFKANGIGNIARLEWMTFSEHDNLGWNIYRAPISKSNKFFSAFPLRINPEIIPGQGTSSGPYVYEYMDNIFSKNNYLYILEAVSIYGETEHFEAHLMWLMQE